MPRKKLHLQRATIQIQVTLQHQIQRVVHLVIDVVAAVAVVVVSQMELKDQMSLRIQLKHQKIQMRAPMQMAPRTVAVAVAAQQEMVLLQVRSSMRMA
jgi:hypothetical protein